MLTPRARYGWESKANELLTLTGKKSIAGKAGPRCSMTAKPHVGQDHAKKYTRDRVCMGVERRKHNQHFRDQLSRWPLGLKGIIFKDIVNDIAYWF